MKLSKEEYRRIRNSILKSGRYIIRNGHLIQDGRVLTINGFVDYYSYFSK
jgi:hypothetical protein